MLVTTVGLAVPLAITALMTVLLTIGYAVHPSSKIEALGRVHRHGPSDRGGPPIDRRRAGGYASG
jgi:hypothetical protein